MCILNTSLLPITRSTQTPPHLASPPIMRSTSLDADTALSQDALREAVLPMLTLLSVMAAAAVSSSMVIRCLGCCTTPPPEEDNDS